MNKALIVLLLFLSTLSLAQDRGLAGFTLTINGEINPYHTYSVFVMPSANIPIASTESVDISGDINASTDGILKWKLKAPDKPGAYQVNITNNEGDAMKINVLVLTPLNEKKGEYLNGFRVGNYPLKPLRGNPIYNRPDGLFEVSEANKNLQLTPHFRLDQFICKQAGDFPKYLIIRERLLLKLEYLLARFNDDGFAINTFGFISGYRTPFYNKEINNVQYSRHVYGGAADIFIDENKDGKMDDLNKDGTINEKDVRIFYDVVEREFGKPGYEKFRGGLGFYRKNSRHSGFIHVDVRGWKARWGNPG